MTSAIRHILLDIEGTTCPISFVSEVLFPYAAREVGAYLARHSHDTNIQALLKELQASWEQEEDPEAIELLRESGLTGQEEQSQPGVEASEDSTAPSTRLLPYIHWLISKDRKLTAWKDLQGRIWHEGYKRGELRAALFPEVATTLQRWKELGFQLSVYSSGSVAAQQLLYGHSESGDLRPLFSHWFDTRIGPKQEASSYRAILEILNHQPEQVLFISDSTAELAAADASGLEILFSDRPGNPDRNPKGFASIQSLEQLEVGSVAGYALTGLQSRPTAREEQTKRRTFTRRGDPPPDQTAISIETSAKEPPQPSSCRPPLAAESRRQGLIRPM